MKFRLFGLFTLLCAVVVILCNQPGASRSQTTKATLSHAEQDLLSEINKARAEPQVYAGYLEKLKPQFKGKLYTPAGMAGGLETQEGWDAVADAINFMKTLKPVPPVEWLRRFASRRIFARQGAERFGRDRPRRR